MGDKKPNRLCLFAGFDKNGEIADYVVYYIKALSQISNVYYWGDFEASDSEKAKIAPYCKGVYCVKHGKYDFGSWQELIQKIGRQEIEKYNELILANDSCYGPLFNLSRIFREMGERDCDFWGLSLAYNRHIHLQSYFLVLKQPVIKSDTFYDFFARVRPEADYCDVCAKYEDRFSYLLSKAGFCFDSYIRYNDLSHHPYKDVISAIKARHFPFLKVKFFSGDIRDQDGVPNWREVIRDDTDYPVELIEEDLTRRGFDLDRIDQAVQEKRSETPNFYYRDPLPLRLAKRIGKVLLWPIITLIDKRTSQYDYKFDRVDRSYRELRRKYDELQAQLGPNSVLKKIHLLDSGEVCDLKLTEDDGSLIKRPDLELPLMNESNILLLGNITLHNLASLGLYESQTTYLNNSWTEILKIDSMRTENLCDFKFIDESGEQVYFDFILVQPLEKRASDEEISRFIVNLKQQMIFESVLVMIVANREKARYEQILQLNNLCPAGSERGLVVSVDPFQTYRDKIGSIKGYSVLVYKIK